LQGNYAGATQPYEQALLINPGVTATEVNLGLSLALSGDAQDALEYLGPLATSSAATPRIREDYAAALVAAGRTDEAQQVLAIDLPPDEVNTLMADFQTAISNAQSTAAPAAAAPTTATAQVAPVAVQALIGPTPAAPAPPAAVTPMAAAAPTGNTAAGDEILR
jgi:thioredoxin-like negative regulator of GroEL